MQDWNNGTIPYYVSPPERAQGESVRLVQDWAADFNIDEVQNATRALQETSEYADIC